MIIYLMLIAFILVFPLVLRLNGNEGEKLDKKFLSGSIFAIFLLAALRAPSVGRDIPSYMKAYQMIQQATWKNFDISYFEWGYEFLMMVFAHVLHMPFQGFIVVVYGFYYFALYQFIRRYSVDYQLSVLIYICFNFFCFDMSAVRNILAIAICFFAVPFAQKKGIKNIFKFIIIVGLATQIHESAYAFLIAYIVMKIPVNRYSFIPYGILLGGLIIYRPTIVLLVDSYIKDMANLGSDGIGGNILVYTMVVAFALFVNFMQQKKTIFMSEEALLRWHSQKHVMDLAVRMMCSAILILIYFNGTTMTRLAQNMLMFMIVLIPASLARVERKDRLSLRVGLSVLLIMYFIKYTLLNNPLDIVPYVFFWK